jgi:hypothetical protein
MELENAEITPWYSLFLCALIYITFILKLWNVNTYLTSYSWRDFGDLKTKKEDEDYSITYKGIISLWALDIISNQSS